MEGGQLSLGTAQRWFPQVVPLWSSLNVYATTDKRKYKVVIHETPGKSDNIILMT